MEQQPHEKEDQFVYRLGQKAITCEFADVEADVEATIRDRLIEKSLDDRFRRKFL